MKDRRASRFELMGIASEQGGYFTSRQAMGAGYGYRLQHFHCKSGNWIREGRGIFRFSHYPTAERPDLIRLALWSRNQRGETQAVTSHETALAIHELSDVMPSKIHLTVPPGFRKESPKNCVLHLLELRPGDWVSREGYRLTTPLKTLLDVAEDNLSQDDLNEAVAQALARGMVREKYLRQAKLNPQGKARLDAALKAKGRAA